MFIISMIFIIAFLANGQVGVKAEEDRLSSAIDEIIAGLDLGTIEDAYDDIPYFSSFDAKSKIRDYLSGNTEFSFADLFGMIVRLVLGSISDYAPEMLTILAVIVFGGIMQSLNLSSLDSSATELGFFVITALVITLTASLFLSVFTTASESVENMTMQIQAVFPVILTLMTASGASVTAAAFQPTVAYICTLESTVARSVLFPITVLLLIFGIVASISKTYKVGRMSDFLKSTFKWITGATSVVFTFFISAQGIASSTFDGFSIKALKYVVGSGVPIVGQLVNGGFDVAFYSCVLVKNSLGVLALIALLISVFSPMVKIAVLSLFLRFLVAVVEPIAEERTAKFISSVADVLNYLAAVVISVAIVYLITVFIAICSLGVAV